MRQTRGRIDSAFVALLHVRSYERIRVCDITRKANVGRATFYAHYESKDALLRDQFGRIVGPMIQLRAGEACPFDCTALFAHILSARRLYLSLVGSKVIRSCFEVRLLDLLHEGPPRHAMESAAIARLVAASLDAFMGWSLEFGIEDSPARWQAQWSGFVGHGLGGT